MMERGSLKVQEVGSARVQPLRTRVLRPGLEPPAVAVFDGDEEGAHFALIRGEGEGEGGGDDGEILAVVSYYCGRPGPEDVQLRGMAVTEELRGQGLGARLLRASLVRVALKWPEARRVWCNARERALSLYEREGFVVVSAPFEVEGIGRHLRMERELPPVMA